MQSAKIKAEQQQQKNKLALSYSELLHEFSSKDLRHVGNYTLGKIVGKGSFGKVYLARHDLTNGSKVVLKASSKEDPNLAREIHHHRQFIHPHIARLYEVIVTENQVWLVLEFCPGDELYNYLVQQGPLPTEKAQKIFTQLVGAVAYIHSKSCVHRDLKLENVLLDKQENVKLVDFGFTREYEGKANYLQTFCGTVCYSAPEMLKGEKYAGEKVDVWSLGIILFSLLKGELPFDEDDDQATKMKILKDDPTYPDLFPEGAKTLISKMLSKRPLYRPTLSDILADPWLVDYAPQQQAILKLSQPAPFTTALEKNTLERMKAAGVDIDKVIENVLSQRCDSLAGWWALLIEKESRKEARRERKRKEKEAELKLLRRLSGASSRLERIAPALEDVAEEGSRPANGTRARSTSRGRANRRSTPQILVSDLPKLPEGTAISSPGGKTPETPIVKRHTRTPSGSRPPLPPKERQRRRSSNLQLMTTNPDLAGPMHGVNKRKPGRRSDKKIFSQLSAFKHWFVESTKRAASPALAKKNPAPNNTQTDGAKNVKIDTNFINGHNRAVSGGTAGSRVSYGATLTPITSNVTSNSNGNAVGPKIDMTKARHRTSLSPSPITPRSSYRRSSQGLRGRKSTSSSVSSIRSMPLYSHSKASSISSSSVDGSTIHSPGSRSVGRSPHTSIKVLPVTPQSSAFMTNSASGQLGTEAAPSSPNGSGVMFARRKKSPFKGPMLNSSTFGRQDSLSVAPVPGSPALFATRNREASDGQVNLGLLNAAARRERKQNPRKSLIIQEEEEEEDEEEGIPEEAIEDDEEEEEEDIEEVDAFTPIDLGRGERVHSIVFYDEPDLQSAPESATATNLPSPTPRRDEEEKSSMEFPKLRIEDEEGVSSKGKTVAV